jgi:tetratricopeptide (TPR) repeat protein
VEVFDREWMKSIAKLKERARKYEQKEDWRSAIEAYRKVLETEESEGQIELELGLFNRVGDLYLRLGQVDEAVTYYEKAADRYAASGFYNNAIALCNKALRHRSERPEIYLKLSRFCHEQGFVTDARRWILDYAERQVMKGNVDAALTGLGEFVEAAEVPEVRELLAQQLAGHGRIPEAVDQLVRAHAEWGRRGDREAVARVAEQASLLDPTIDLDDAGPPDLPGLDENDASDGFEGAAAPQSHEVENAALAGGLEGLETYRSGMAEAPGQADALELDDRPADPGGAGDEADDEGPAGQAAGFDDLQTFESGADPDQDGPWAGAGVEPVPGAGVVPELDEEEPEPLPLLETGFQQEGGEEPVPLPLLEHEHDGPDGEAAGHTADRDDWLKALEAEAAELAAPAEREPVDMGPVEAEPVEAEPVEAEPVEAEPVDAEPVGEEEVEQEVAEPAPPEARVAPAPLEPIDLAGPLDVGGVDPYSAGWGDLDDSEEPLDLDLGDMGGVQGSASGAAREDEMDVDAILDRAKQLVSRGLTGEAIGELRLLAATDASPEVFREAMLVTKEVLRRSPNDISVRQRRVEFASRIGDRRLLVETYTELAQSLEATGAEGKARAMYQRVLALDPKNAVAREALGDDAVLDDVTTDLEPIGQGQPHGSELAALLSAMKTRPSAPAEEEDAAAHYDLGLAFKEMGLIEEAIAEFQTALRAGEERLKVFEELGQCFMLNGQHTIALKVLKRALEAPRQDEADVLGVYYHLGQCHEALGQPEEARAAYEQVLAIDHDFEDVPSRIGRL